MNIYNEVDGDLIELALQGHFDVIAHGCNCFNIMGAGLAIQMAKVFKCDEYYLEQEGFKGEYERKLGNIDIGRVKLDSGKSLNIVNAYIQYYPGPNLNYSALTLCLLKINHAFKGKHIGLPYVIGCGLAGGDITKVIHIIKEKLKDMKVTLVKLPNYEQS